MLNLRFRLSDLVEVLLLLIFLFYTFQPVNLSIYITILLLGICTFGLLINPTAFRKCILFFPFISYAFMSAYLISPLIQDKGIDIEEFYRLVFCLSAFILSGAHINKTNFERKWMAFALFLSFLAIIQQVGYLLGFIYLYDFSWLGFFQKIDSSHTVFRSMSIFYEPGHFAFFLFMPLYLSLTKINYKKYRLIICLGFLSTFSIGSFIFLFFAILLLGVKKYGFRYLFSKAGYLVFLALFFFILYSYNPVINEKLNSLIFFDKSYASEYGTTWVLYSSFLANINAFIESPIFGVGFGGARLFYENEFYRVFGFGLSELDYRFVIPDALFLMKLTTEIGLVGIIFFCLPFFVLRNGCTDSYIALVFAFLISCKMGAYYNPYIYILICYYVCCCSNKVKCK
ncbi:putative Wzy [Vibrio chagasii]|nr:putative Wzy [Vibrio chagasii]